MFNSPGSACIAREMVISWLKQRKFDLDVNAEKKSFFCWRVLADSDRWIDGDSHAVDPSKHSVRFPDQKPVTCDSHSFGTTPCWDGTT